ncbi:MAG: hypothetical protein CMO69_05055 [Verrucomicrobiales bacterium]|nr:hypothetical protein [Verrucomicrobiales bacterium]
MFAKRFIFGNVLLLIFTYSSSAQSADDFQNKLQPIFASHCVKCHGGEKVKGKINLKEIASAAQFLAKPKLIKEIIDVLDAGDMPPEGESQLNPTDQEELLASLRAMLLTSSSGKTIKHNPPRRLNRFQYNNTVRDLFQLNRDVFALSEKLLTRETIYLNAPTMPKRVNARSLALNPTGGMREVKPFPQDLRASHGFDNQADQLTLSPLLLDAFFRLSISIVESPDFNENSVGIWENFFKAPAEGVDIPTETQKRITNFLRLAFRGPVALSTIDRYTNYAIKKLEGGMRYNETMKKIASAVLSSPLFLYHYNPNEPKLRPFAIASNLSFFLWGSSPDTKLLELADNGELVKPEILEKTIRRMLTDPRIERFLDSFPSQWMQLENILAATPDPKLHRYFSLDKQHPASLQMLIEPLLLFDAIFVENRPISELIMPNFSYRSDFLNDWYASDLKPKKIDRNKIKEENKPIQVERGIAELEIQKAKASLEEYIESIPAIIDKTAKSLDLSPGQASWEANQLTQLANNVALSPWQRIGPFGEENLKKAHERAFINETVVDLKKNHGNLKWKIAESLRDGKQHQLNGANCSTYLFRTIHSSIEQERELSIGSDDSFKIWLNGKLIANKYITRGLAPDQDKIKVRLAKGKNKLLFKVSNGGGGYGFYFKTEAIPLPSEVVTAVQVKPTKRTEKQKSILAAYYRTFASELSPIRQKIAATQSQLEKRLNQTQSALNKLPKPRHPDNVQSEMNRQFDDVMRDKVRSNEFVRVETKNPRYGGVITSAAILSMNNGTRRTHPIARGAWMIEVIFNDPPPPPPNDVPPLNEDAFEDHLTIREKFAKHRESPDCAGCHSRLDPLGFALENFDITGRWRDKYPNGRNVNSTGVLLRKYPFNNVVEFKQSISKENKRFAKAFASHLLRFALSRELSPRDMFTIDKIVNQTKGDNFRLKSLITEVIKSDSFLRKSENIE